MEYWNIGILEKKEALEIQEQYYLKDVDNFLKLHYYIINPFLLYGGGWLLPSEKAPPGRGLFLW